MISAQPHRSYWLQQVANDAPDAVPLRGSTKADIAILGGGYVGLWTAIRIKEQQPDCAVVVLEQDICGGGASGRNGGFVLSWWPKLASLTKLLGPEEAVRVCQSSEQAIYEIQSFCEANRIDADFRRGGWLWAATSKAQWNAWNGVVNQCERIGVPAFERLDPAEVSSRAGSKQHLAGVFQLHAAVVQPAALVRGLRRVALERGVRIFEHTKVRSFTRTQPVTLRTAEGNVQAEKLVIANNAWAASIRELHTSIAVISSDIVVTAPIPERLAQIGWNQDLSITDSQTMVCCYRITRDGRIAFGKGGWTIGFSGRIGANFDRHPQRAAEVTTDLRRYYPMLADVPVTHDWSGPIDRTPDSIPRLGPLRGCPNIVHGVGWSGNGVGPSVLGGKILASLALGIKMSGANIPSLMPPTSTSLPNRSATSARTSSGPRLPRKKGPRIVTASRRSGPCNWQDSRLPASRTKSSACSIARRQPPPQPGSTYGSSARASPPL
jgi:glycine/D-amino acid oxidase-like deaminating enzyme